MADIKDDDQTVKSIRHLILDGQPSCLEFCQLYEGVFVVGSYKLEEESAILKKEGEEDDDGRPAQARSGSIVVFKLEKDLNVTLLHTTDFEAGVLDAHFSPHDPGVLAVALSDGALQLSRLIISTSSIVLSRLYTQTLLNGLILAVAWNPAAETAHELAVSTSTGSFTVLRFSEDWASLCSDVQFHDSHTLEAWTLSWPMNSDEQSGIDTSVAAARTLYTGGDDAVLCHWDLSLLESLGEADQGRLPADVEFERHLVHKGIEAQPGLQADRRTHEAGVTAILPLPVFHSDGSEIVITGSYDEHIRVLAISKGSRWKTLAEKRLHGGVWRLKVIESSISRTDYQKWLLLASCMHAGCQLIELSCCQGSWTIEQRAHFEEHESTNYASDVVPVSDVLDDHANCTIVSTSFFDRKLCVWTAARLNER